MTKEQYNIIFDSLKNKIFRFANSILYNQSEAEDITQDIFMKLWLNPSWLKKYENIESFLMRMTKNNCLDKIKHRKVVQNSIKDLKILKNDTVHQHEEKKDIAKIIKSLIQQLPEKQKLIIHLRDIEGYEFEEISEVLKINMNAVRVNLSRARKTIKEEITKTINYGL